MTSKILNSLGSFGLALLLAGFFYYSVTDQWDWKAQLGIYGGLAFLAVYVATNLGRIRIFLRTRSFRYGGMALLTLVMVFAILALLNFLNFRHHKRIDLSENQLNELSGQTQKVLKNLDRDIQVIGFFEDRPNSRAREFQDRLKEFRYLSSRVGYEVVNPQEEPGKVSQFEITRNGQVVVASGPSKEILDDFSEEKLTNAIIKVTREEAKTVYFLQGHGERDLEDTDPQGLSSAKEGIERQNYLVRTYNLAQENQLPEDATVLVSAGPRVNFFPNEVQLLESYLTSGGKLFLLIDPQTDFAMDDFLAQFGVKLGHDVVIDASGLGRLLGLGAAAPLVAEYADHPITRDLNQVMTFFPLAQSVEATESSLEFQSSYLLRSSERSWGEIDLSGEEVTFDEGIDQPGPLNLAVVSTKSVEAEQTAEPESEEGLSDQSDAQTSDDEAPADAASAEEEDLEEPLEKSAGEARLVVFGDSDFALNNYFDSSANGDLFLNVVSWLAEDTDLISVRPKSPTSRTLTLTVSESRLLFWALVVLLPAATLVVGVTVWTRRR